MPNNMFTRRDLLKILGITAAGLQLMPERLIAAAAQRQGRALTAAPVRTAPHADAPIQRYLWPDSVIQITGQRTGWYRTEGGYVAQTHIQPMTPPDTVPAPLAAPPFWATVTGAAATVHRWCAADAPLVTRIGHGGMAYMVDFLAPGWYGLVDADNTWLGWTQAAPWQPITYEQPASVFTRLVLDTQQFTLSGYQAEQESLHTPVALGSTLQPGQYHVTSTQPGTIVGVGEKTYHGAPWPLSIEADGWLTGVYWHNQFGAQVDGPAVQINTGVARWLAGYDGPLIVR